MKTKYIRCYDFITHFPMLNFQKIYEKFTNTVLPKIAPEKGRNNSEVILDGDAVKLS